MVNCVEVFTCEMHHGHSMSSCTKAESLKSAKQSFWSSFNNCVYQELVCITGVGVYTKSWCVYQALVCILRVGVDVKSCYVYNNAYLYSALFTLCSNALLKNTVIPLQILIDLILKKKELKSF